VAVFKRTLNALGKAGAAIESALLVVLLLSMIGLSTAQIVLRNFFNVGFYWSDTLLRTLVLWIALAGAVAASRADKHISINLLDNLLGKRLKGIVRLLVHAFSAGICGMVAWFSTEFVLTTREYGDIALGNVPAWILQLVLPIGFGLICYRYLLFCITDLGSLLGGSGGEGRE
jgi:TRAP-type C4-dicarboxylate transport system permease small subunit